MLQRNITIDDIQNALMDCQIIEQYPEAYPHPACLILGMAVNNKYIHVTCGASETELWLITAYYPDTDEWENDLKTRKGQK